ncbi:MAG TPA: hypothetical protein PKU67_04155 [Candidatus Hydrothermia bacterium]|nr:hypothetical protein [Candidatus Hydrothermia bacterium]HOL23913.1 hypothetical protein [Candidatus Hydrothermia bacterium]HPO78918.1 hypothetical protein [Candidatus Hydrothermia bacterium]
MKKCSIPLILVVLCISLSCKKISFLYEDEAVLAVQELSELYKDLDSNEVVIQLAQLPEPEGIPILVGIDKAFWVQDPTDPTPFINTVYVYGNLYINSYSSFGEYLHSDSGWVKIYPSDSLISLKWLNGADTLDLILSVHSYREISQYLHIISGSLDLKKNQERLYTSNFEIDGTVLSLNSRTSDVAAQYLSAGIESMDPTFVGSIDGGVVRMTEDQIYGDTVRVAVECHRDSTRSVSVTSVYSNVTFLLDTEISSIQHDSGDRKYRPIDGNFLGNKTDIGDVKGVKYEFDDSQHRSFLRITLESGQILNIW